MAKLVLESLPPHQVILQYYQKYRVMLIVCDPKADSSVNLLGGRKIDTVLDVIRNKEEDTELDDLINIGYNGVIYCRIGRVYSGIGCAGLGIITDFSKA